MVYAAFGILTLVGNFTMPMALIRAGRGRGLMRIALVFVLAAIAVTYIFDALAPILVLPALALWAVLGGMGSPDCKFISRYSPPPAGVR